VKKAAEAKAKTEAEAKANHKTKSQRIEAHKAANARRKEEEEEDTSDDEEETEADRRARMRQQERDADLKHAEDLFAEVNISKARNTSVPVRVDDPDDPSQKIDLSKLSIFKPTTKDQFAALREILVPLLTVNNKKGQYSLFLQDFTKQLAKDLPSDQIKKIASGLTALSNEKMKEEKAAEKGGKKTKAAKTKTSLNASRDIAYKADNNAYDDFGEYVLCFSLLKI
jgi:translation initiation factor 3 subunit J